MIPKMQRFYDPRLKLPSEQQIDDMAIKTPLNRAIQINSEEDCLTRYGYMGIFCVHPRLNISKGHLHLQYFLSAYNNSFKIYS